MTVQLSSHDRRVLGAGILIVSSLIGIGRATPRVMLWRDTQRQEMASLNADLERFERLRTRRVQMLGSIGRLQTAIDVIDSTLTSGRTPNEAGARLALWLTDAAEARDVLVENATVRADSTFVGPYAVVRVRLSGQTDVTGLLQVMQDVEGGENRAVVDELSVTPADITVTEGRMEVLRISLVISALVRREQGDAK